jgi:hypothetical protein
LLPTPPQYKVFIFSSIKIILGISGWGGVGIFQFAIKNIFFLLKMSKQPTIIISKAILLPTPPIFTLFTFFSIKVILGVSGWGGVGIFQFAINYLIIFKINQFIYIQFFSLYNLKIPLPTPPTYPIFIL